MGKDEVVAQSRSRLDHRFKKIGPAEQFAAPVRGWVRAIRQGLGMSTAQLARRLGIKQPSVVALEQSEVKGTIELATLRRVAEALDCTVIYALVPRKPLESMVRERARGVARRRLAAIEHSMLLEDQAASGQDFEARLEELAHKINRRLLWED